MARLSFTTMATPGMALRDCLALAQRYGFNGIDIRCHMKNGEVRPDDTPRQCATVAALFQVRNLQMPSVLCYNCWPEQAGANWDSAAEELRRMLTMAEQLNAPAIRLFPKIPADGKGLDSYVNESAAMIRQVFSESTNNIAVYLQNHVGSLNARQSAELCRQVNDSRLGMVYSPDHVFLMDESYAGLLEDIAFCVREIFIADINGNRKNVFPGTGAVPLKETIRFFTDRGFDGFFSFKWEKIWRPELADASEALPEFMRFMASS